jgi:hypothetical protein
MGFCSKQRCGCALVFWAVLMAVLIIIGEVVMPNIVKNLVHQGLKIESAGDMSDYLKDEGDRIATASSTITVFNLTNAYAMQTQSPAPKPHFVPIEVAFTERQEKFDGEYIGGAHGSYKYSAFNTWTPANPADLDMQIVQVNPAYLGSIYALAPSEVTLYVGLSHTILGVVNQALVGFGAQMMAASGGACADAAGCAALQFATSALSDAALSQASVAQGGPAVTGSSISMIPAVQALGVCTPVEIVRFMNDVSVGVYHPFVTGGSLATLLGAQGYVFSSFSMTPAQATAFLAMFQLTGHPSGAPNYATALFQLVTGWSTALQTALAQQTAAAAASANGDAATAATAAAAATAAQQQAIAAATSIQTYFSTTFGTLMATPLAGGGSAEIVCGSTVPTLCPVVASAYVVYLIQYLGDTFFTGCQLVGTMQPDGTGSLNSGLFIRRTLREILHGYVDPLFTAVPASAVPAGLTLEFNGALGNYSRAATTLADLRAAFASGAQNATEWSYEYNGGGADIKDVGKWVAREGETVGDFGYDDNGRPATPPATAQFLITGKGYQNSQPPSDKAFSSMSMVANDFEDSEFAEGSSITFLLTTIRRMVTIGCGSGFSPSGSCAWHDVEGIKTHKFGARDGLLLTTVDGVRSTTCRGTTSRMGGTTLPSSMATGTPPTCDWLMRDDGVINLEVVREAPFAVTLGYLGKTDPAIRNAVSITAAVGDATEVNYVEAQHELALYFEPITGQAVQGLERLQSNFYVEAAMLNSARYANVFSTTTRFVWPYLFVQRHKKIESDDATRFKDNIYFAYRVGFALDIVGIVLCPLFLICACVMFRQASQASTDAGGVTLSTASAPSSSA